MIDGSIRVFSPYEGGRFAGDNSIFGIACSLNNPNKLPLPDDTQWNLWVAGPGW